MSVSIDLTAPESVVSVMREFVSGPKFQSSFFPPLLGEIIRVSSDSLKRQLSDFLEGGKFAVNLSTDVLEILNT